MISLLLTTAAAWLPGVNILKWLRGISYVAVLVAGGWGAVRVQNWWHGDKLTVVEAQQRCDFTMANAAVRARLGAVLAREQSVKAREATVAADEKSIADEIKRMEDIRHASAGKDAAGIALDERDVWLQSWRARRLDRPRHR